jgi:hypothetical protein
MVLTFLSFGYLREELRGPIDFNLFALPHHLPPSAISSSPSPSNSRPRLFLWFAFTENLPFSDIEKTLWIGQAEIYCRQLRQKMNFKCSL